MHYAKRSDTMNLISIQRFLKCPTAAMTRRLGTGQFLVLRIKTNNLNKLLMLWSWLWVYSLGNLLLPVKLIWSISCILDEDSLSLNYNTRDINLVHFLHSRWRLSHWTIIYTLFMDTGYLKICEVDMSLFIECISLVVESCSDDFKLYVQLV